MRFGILLMMIAVAAVGSGGDDDDGLLMGIVRTMTPMMMFVTDQS